jgi:hypothetical protein
LRLLPVLSPSSTSNSSASSSWYVDQVARSGQKEQSLTMSYRSHHSPKTHLGDELDDTTSLLDLLLSEPGNKSPSSTSNSSASSSWYVDQVARSGQKEQSLTFSSVTLARKRAGVSGSFGTDLGRGGCLKILTNLVEVDGGSVVLVLEKVEDWDQWRIFKDTS